MHSTWISVDERLPEQYANVLVASGGSVECGYRITGLITKATHWYADSGRTQLENVTHWMPLPEPPEVVRAEGKW